MILIFDGLGHQLVGHTLVLVLMLAVAHGPGPIELKAGGDRKHRDRIPPAVPYRRGPPSVDSTRQRQLLLLLLALLSRARIQDMLLRYSPEYTVPLYQKDLAGF